MLCVREIVNLNYGRLDIEALHILAMPSVASWLTEYVWDIALVKGWFKRFSCLIQYHFYVYDIWKVYYPGGQNLKNLYRDM